MSLLAEVLEAIRYTEYQNELILSRKFPLHILAKRFKKSVRQLQRQRKLLLEIEELENEQREKYEREKGDETGQKPGAERH